MPAHAIPAGRWPRWVENFGTRHGETALMVRDGALCGEGADGSWFRARLPFEETYDGPATAEAFAGAVNEPDRWGVLLVRKGGFAIALLEHGGTVASKVGQRHVQGKTKAGGQSQQRFARRRQKQAREAFEAAADHAARILGGCRVVVTGGDHSAVDAVLEDPRFARVEVSEPWLAVPDPKRAVLDAAIAEARSIRIQVENASQGD